MSLHGSRDRSILVGAFSIVLGCPELWTTVVAVVVFFYSYDYQWFTTHET